MEFSKLMELLVQDYANEYGSVLVTELKKSILSIELMNDNMHAYYYEDNFDARSSQDGLRIELTLNSEHVIIDDPWVEEFDDSHGGIIGYEFSNEKEFDRVLMDLFYNKEKIVNIAIGRLL